MAAKSLDDLLFELEYRAWWLEDEFKNRRVRDEVRSEIAGMRRAAKRARRERDRELDGLIAAVRRITTDVQEARAPSGTPILRVIQGDDDA